MFFKLVLIFCFLISFSCNNAATSSSNKKIIKEKPVLKALDKNPYHLITQIPLPQGYHRIDADTNSFAYWLRNIPLKVDKTVYLFNGNKKTNQLAQFAVLDIAVGNKDLQQCADAIMRLRAAYLFAQKRFTEISFTDNENIVYAFKPTYTNENFAKYLDVVFGMCGTASLSKQLKNVNNFYSIQPGEVLIRGGFPGHAEIVVDVAENNQGKKIFMLAQSYMPAQDIHILINPNGETLSPWYLVDDEEQIATPEYLFYKKELKQW